MKDTPPLTLAFDAIRRYAALKGWQPIGFRSWRVGSWSITVNGTGIIKSGVLPYHAHVANETYLGVMVLNPFRGNVAGFSGTEDAFIRDMETAIKELQQ